MGRLKYDRQFKLLAVKLIKDQRMPVTQISREISVHVDTLHRWLKEYVEQPAAHDNGESQKDSLLASPKQQVPVAS